MYDKIIYIHPKSGRYVWQTSYFILFSNINKICKNQNESNPFYIKKSAAETFCFNNEVNLPNSEVYLPNSKVDLLNSKVNLPNSKVDISNSKVDLTNSKVDLPNSKVDLPNSKVDLSKSKVDLKCKKINKKPKAQNFSNYNSKFFKNFNDCCTKKILKSISKILILICIFARDLKSVKQRHWTQQ